MLTPRKINQRQEPCKLVTPKYNLITTKMVSKKSPTFGGINSIQKSMCNTSLDMEKSGTLLQYYSPSSVAFPFSPSVDLYSDQEYETSGVTQNLFTKQCVKFGKAGTLGQDVNRESPRKETTDQGVASQATSPNCVSSILFRSAENFRCSLDDR